MLPVNKIFLNGSVFLLKFDVIVNHFAKKFPIQLSHDLLLLDFVGHHNLEPCVMVLCLLLQVLFHEICPFLYGFRSSVNEILFTVVSFDQALKPSYVKLLLPDSIES